MIFNAWVVVMRMLFFLDSRRKEIGVLHNKFGMEFDSVIRSVTESEIKNSAVPFKVDQAEGIYMYMN